MGADSKGVTTARFLFHVVSVMFLQLFRRFDEE